MSDIRTRFLFLNVGHFLDHWFMLIFATVAALQLSREWNMSYAQLIPYATPGFVAFGACALLAGWLADRWSRSGMIVVFFIGIGVSSIATSFATSPLQIAAGLTMVGVFAAIYHPVGLAMVVEGRERTGIPLAINGVFGNMGVACAALITGIFIDGLGWRSAFVIPGILSIMTGIAYLVFENRATLHPQSKSAGASKSSASPPSISRPVLIRIFAIIFFSTAIGGLIFQSTTFSLPKVMDEQLTGSATQLGAYAFVVFSVAALAQLVVGFLVDRHSIRVVFVVIASMQAIFFFVMTRVDGLLSILIAIAFMLAVFGQIPINDVLVGRAARSEWRSRAYAIRYVVTFSVMASAVPLIAWMHSRWGFDGVFTVLGFAACLILVSVALLPNAAIVARQPSAGTT